MSDESTGVQCEKRKRLTRDDHEALREYFGHGGMARLEQSPLGPQLAKLERHGRMKKCWVCNGHGRLPPGTEHRHADAVHAKRLERAWVLLQLVQVRVAKQVIGKHLSRYRQLRDDEHRPREAEEYRRKHAEQIRQQAEAEHGPRGKAAQKRMLAEAEAIRQVEGTPNDGWCHFCKGSGWAPVSAARGGSRTIDARPTGSSITTESQMELSDITVERLGRATRFLRAINPKHHAVFAHYYAPAMGGIQAVWEITPMGMALLKQHREEVEKAGQKGAIDLAACQVLHEVWENQRLDPQPKRGTQVETMRQQAHDMLREATDAWCEARDALRPKRRLVPDDAVQRIRAPKSATLTELGNLVRDLVRLGAA